jgi:glycosyltransferase involved in cell wall biosynthesis
MLAAESRFYRNYEGAIVAISRQIANELQDFYSVRGPITIIPHGVNTGRFNFENRESYRTSMRRQIGITEDDTLALYVGDLTKAHVHLKALAHTAPDVQLVIVSPSKSYHWNAPNVRIFPLSKEIEKFYAAADAFVFPSVNDPFGMVVLEAMASGLTVFSSDQAGVSELIEHGKDGFVFSLDDWVEATVAGLGETDSLLAVGSEAEKTASQHDWLTVVRRVEEVYGTITAHEPLVSSDSRSRAEIAFSR